MTYHWGYSKSNMTGVTSGAEIHNDEFRFLLDQHAELDFYSASTLKQQSAGRHVAPLGHIILILSQPVLALSR